METFLTITGGFLLWVLGLIVITICVSQLLAKYAAFTKIREIIEENKRLRAADSSGQEK